MFSDGAVTRTKQLAGLCSRGPVIADESGRVKPDIAAPGADVLSAFPGDTYAIESGTSGEAGDGGKIGASEIQTDFSASTGGSRHPPPRQFTDQLVTRIGEQLVLSTPVKDLTSRTACAGCTKRTDAISRIRLFVY